MTDNVTSTPVIRVNGRQITDQSFDRLRELRIAASTAAAAHATLTFVDDDDETLGASFAAGSTLEILASNDASNTVLFSGEILTVGFDFDAATRSQITVGAFDASHRLGQHMHVESYLKHSPADVIKQIADNHGLSAKVDSTLSASRAHIQQAGTPRAFLTELAEAYGCEWWIDGSTLVVERRSKRGSVVKLSGESDLRSFSARFSAIDRADEVEVRGWDPKQNEPIVGSDRFETAQVYNRAMAIDTAYSLAGRGARDVSVWPRDVTSIDEAQRIAQGLNRRIGAAAVTGRGALDVDPRLKPGICVEISEVATNWNGEYYVTEVEHLFGTTGSFTTRFRIGAHRPTSLVDLFGPTEPTSLERLTNGVTIGEVTNIEDPDNLARVKVSLPILSDDNESDWVRVLQLGAGAARGMSISPDVGDEVLVAFENGDLQRPFVLGGLWSGSKRPVNANAIKAGKVEQWSITNDTGDTIVMSRGGGADNEYIELALHKDAAVLFLGTEKTELTTPDKPITISTKDASITMDNGEITIKANKITLDAKQDITLKGTNIKGTAKANAELTGTAGIKLKGAQAELAGDATTTIKGGMVNIN